MIRVAISGYGRIGRSFLRAVYEANLQSKLTIVAIHELAEPEAMAHLTKYDSTHGRFSRQVTLKNQTLYIDDDPIQLYHEELIEKLPWQSLDIDVVIEATGQIKTKQQALAHHKAGAKKVLISHPASPDVDATVVFGVNDQQLTGKEVVVSNASCTTNCCVPILKLLHDAFHIERGAITTIHSSMNDQQVIDAYHSDLRLTRSASQSIIPVNTKLARGIERILPDLTNKFEAIAVRVPTINVTAMDLSLTLRKSVDIETINQLIEQASNDTFEGIVGFTREPLVSCDFNHDARSSIVDGTQTRVSDGHLVKILLWCDNEWGYVNRMMDTAQALFQDH